MAKIMFISLLMLSIVSLSVSQEQCTNSNQVRAGYWLSNSNHYSPLDSINTSLYTHLYYCSIAVDYNQATISIPSSEEVPFFMKFSSTLKSTNPSLKTLVSVFATTQFSSIASDTNRREKLILSTIQLARANGFDGVDLSWQFPSSSADMANLAELLTKWRSKIDEENQTSLPPLLLTATLYFSNHIFDMPDQNLDYPIDVLSYNLDWANILSFSFRKSTNVTIYDAPLYDMSSHYSASYGIISWLDAGLPPCKIVMGLPLFGRSWILRNKAKNELGSPIVAAGLKQKMSNHTGLMAYSEIANISKDSSVSVSYDNRSVAAYLFSSSTWVSFDSFEVVHEKVMFALQYRLLGYFVWPINFDDSDYSMSDQALQIWLKYRNSLIYEEGNIFGFGFGQTEAPSNSPPHSLNPSQASRLTHHNLLLFLLLFLFF
ncbi:chitinase-3-like protein 1 [Carex littledalei]|uniref:Chitinase-3-like protein 1 n=1 Tax=Carex littledalei TaxID=544730 RepID=A0A833VTC3_9POAL|nr:chitinase-3-like protein 1 [Carex littledalei]